MYSFSFSVENLSSGGFFRSISRLFALGLVFSAAFLLTSCDSSSSESADGPEWSLSWSDEFDGTGIDSDKWGFDLGTNGNGWGNNELQFFTDRSENARIEDGCLVIEAKKESWQGMDYTSARLKTGDLASFRYGKIEARIKVPEGQGLWPAFWMLGNNVSKVDWPFCGEIDIMEMVGGSASDDSPRGDGVTHGTIHWFDETAGAKTSNGKSLALESGKLADEFHVYGLEWDLGEIRWFLDGEQFHSADISAPHMKEFTRSFFLILNVAVGGNWPGSPDDATAFPQKMLVDWIRYYSDDSLSAPIEKPAGDSEVPVANFYDAAMDVSVPGLETGLTMRFGGTNLPALTRSEAVWTGSISMNAAFPGGNWGGVYFKLPAPKDMSSFSAAGGVLSFEIRIPDSISSIEIKMESSSGATSVQTADYAAEPGENGFVRYEIPLADFTAVDYSAVTVPFSLWNPTDGDGSAASGDVLVSKVRFE